MPYYTPSTAASERSPPAPNSTPTIVCLSCGDTMKHFRTISKLGVRREQLMFVCPVLQRGRYKGAGGVRVTQLAGWALFCVPGEGTPPAASPCRAYLLRQQDPAP